MKQRDAAPCWRVEPSIARQVSLGPTPDDLAGTRDREGSRLVFRLRRILSMCRPFWMQSLQAELRSLPYRMKVARWSRWDTCDGDPTVPDHLAREIESFPGIRTYRHAYIRDMTRLQDDYPLLTAFDLHLARRAWNDGTCCSYGNPCFCNESRQSMASGKFTP